MAEAFSGAKVLAGTAVADVLGRARIAVFGLGGVGSYVAEALARCGVASLTLVDNGRVSVNDINRTFYALHSTVGESNVQVAKARIRDIDEEILVHTYETFYNEETAGMFDLSNYDYISIAPDSEIQHEINSIDKFGADGDYLEEELINHFDKDSIRAKLYDSYHKYCNGKKGIIYAINRQHPIVEKIIELAPEARRTLELLLTQIENTIPLRQIFIDMTGDGDAIIDDDAAQTCDIVEKLSQAIGEFKTAQEKRSFIDVIRNIQPYKKFFDENKLLLAEVENYISVK